MDFLIEVLAARLLSEDLHETVVKHRPNLKWAASVSIQPIWDIIDIALAYDEKHGKLPGRRALYEFAVSSEEPLISRRAEAIMPDLKALSNIPPELFKEFTDIDSLVMLAVEETRKEYHVNIYKKAINVVLQGKSTAKDAPPSGCQGAMELVRKRWSYDLNDVPPELAGIWQDNTEALRQQLADYQEQKKQRRVKLGFPKIDADFIATWGKAMFLAGSSGDGKSTLLHSMVYNMARAGENVLYISLEFSPREIWEFLAFIHCHLFHDRMFLPSQGVWAAGQASAEDKEHMDLVIEDIKQRVTVPGIIDVQRFFTWDEIQAYYEINNPKQHYTVVCVDYLYKCNVDFNPKYPQDAGKARDALVSKVINWVHSQDAFLLISPHQVNRESHKSAKKEGSTGYDLDALYASSAVQQDADLVMSVFSPEELKGLSLMSVKFLKGRKPAGPFRTHNLKVDARTGYVRDEEEVTAELKARAAVQREEIWQRVQDKERAAAQAAGREYVEKPNGVIEVPVVMADSEVL